MFYGEIVNTAWIIIYSDMVRNTDINILISKVYVWWKMAIHEIVNDASDYQWFSSLDK